MSDYYLTEARRKRELHEHCAKKNQDSASYVTCAGFEEALLTTTPPEGKRVKCSCCDWQPAEEYIRRLVLDQETIWENG